VGGEKSLDALPQGAVTAAGPIQIGSALPRGQLQCRRKDSRLQVAGIIHEQIT
jgi:hypothetical protein